MWEKPLPNIDFDNKPLFEAYRDHEFVLYRCRDCGDWYFPKSFCRNHENKSYFGNIELAEASGNGTMFSYATTRRLFHAGFKRDMPYTFALIKLDEGPMFGSQLLNIDVDDVEIGIPVTVTWQDIPEDEIPPEKREGFPLDDRFSLPYFTPVKTEGSA